MTEQKIFAGPRIRRIRNGLSLTQTAMAAGLEISPSYLNLIERNQRPLTVQLILKLAAKYQIDPAELQGQEGKPVAALREVFSDPLLARELPGDGELVELADAAPNVASGLVTLYQAYREQQQRLSDLTEMLARAGHETATAHARLPAHEVREVFEARANYFAQIEAECESFAQTLEEGVRLRGALTQWLQANYGIGVRVLPAAVMPNWRRRFDHHSRRLFVSERLSLHDQLREIAIEAVLLRMDVTIAAETEALNLSSDEARRLARFELARYGAHAMMMPYGPFLQAAQRAAYDLTILAARFEVSFEQAAHRLTNLAAQGQEGVPFFLMEVDHAGNGLRRAGARGFPTQRFGGGCPKLSVHSAFNTPGQLLVELVEMPDGAEFITISRTLEGPAASFLDRPRRTAILLGCDLGFASDIVYGQPPAAPMKIETGSICRLCERAGCLSRAEAPITRPLGLDERITGMSAFDFI